MKILLLTKSTPWCHLVQDVLRKSQHDVTIADGPHVLPVETWRGDLIVSFLSPWILKPNELAAAPRTINFHPAPDSHPGFAPYSWAIYYGDAHYGITVHEMLPKVDTGPIIYEEAVPIYSDDSVWRLQQRTMRVLFRTFVNFLEGNVTYRRRAGWLRSPRTKADFENLRQLRDDMPSWEIERRIRACRYPGQPGAYFPGEAS